MEHLIEILQKEERVRKALRQLETDHDKTVERQMLLCAIPSPSNEERERSLKFLELFKELPFDTVEQDEADNVFGVIKGSCGKKALLVSAHMDTVFDRDTDVVPKIDANGVIHAPGIADDTRGMAEVLALAEAVLKNGIRPVNDLIFCGDVGEESMGNLRGVRTIFGKPNRIGAFISIDGSSVDTLHLNAVASVKLRVTFRGTGGHGFRMFGYPNANFALGRAVAKIADLKVPSDPVTVFNTGVLKGGTSINAIPTESQMLVDIRSLDNDILKDTQEKITARITDACEEENVRWSHPTERVTVSIDVIGSRPGGVQDSESPLVKAAEAAYRAFGIEPKVSKGSSTDANLPISLSIPAIAVGRGGSMKYGHTVNEEYDPKNGFLGPQRNLILILLAAGLEGVCEPCL